MASSSSKSVALFALLALQLLGPVLARNIPATEDGRLEPEWFGKHDRSFLIPGVGRVIAPKKGQHVNPFTYNPTTGKNGGYGISVPGLGVTTGRSYIPGGDDTPLPTPAFEVPVPSRH